MSSLHYQHHPSHIIATILPPSQSHQCHCNIAITLLRVMRQLRRPDGMVVMYIDVACAPHICLLATDTRYQPYGAALRCDCHSRLLALRCCGVLYAWAALQHPPRAACSSARVDAGHSFVSWALVVVHIWRCGGGDWRAVVH